MWVLKVLFYILLLNVFRFVEARDYYFILSPQRVFTYGSGNINIELNYNGNLKPSDYKVDFIGSGLSVFGSSVLSKTYAVQVKSFTEMYGTIHLLITKIDSGTVYKTNSIKIYNNDLYKNYVSAYLFEPVLTAIPIQESISSWTPPPRSNSRFLEVLKIIFEFNKGLTYLTGFLLGVLIGLVPVVLKF